MYSESELLGAAHSIVRHPDMPRCVPKLLWLTIQNGKCISAYVLNRAPNDDGYWVLAQVDPKRDAAKNIIGSGANDRADSLHNAHDGLIRFSKTLAPGLKAA